MVLTAYLELATLQCPVGIVKDCGPGNTGWIPSSGKRYFLLRSAKTSSGSNLASYGLGTRGLYPGVKQSECEGDQHPHPMKGLSMVERYLNSAICIQGILHN
jgi:hypothetical protein